MQPRLAALPWLGALLVALPTPARAQEHEHRGLLSRLRPPGAEDSWLGLEAITGDWFGARPRLEELGATLSVSLVSDSSWPFSGGIRHRRTDRALFDVALELDLERAAGLENATAFAEFYSQAGRDGSDDVGDVQAYSNIDADNVSQLAELWFQQTSADGDLRLKVGKVDANSEFAHVNAGFGFLHSSAGYSPTIFLLPTYPDPAVSVNLFARPGAGWRLGLGVYNARDGDPVSGRRGLTAEFEEAFLIGQVGRWWAAEDGLGAGRLAVGVWHHTGDQDRFDGGRESGVEGAYAVLEQRLARERPELPADRQGLVGFLQAGVADGAVSELEGHLGAGLLYTGLIPGCDSWQTGLYASHVDLTDEPAAGLGDHELAIELFQEVLLTPSIVLKPDVQLIVDPSGLDSVGDAWVATLRVELVF